jgi:hypothetical protein
MSLSRLENLGSNPTGVQLYVDPSNFDSTDSIENRGTSPLRPFSSLQRCLLEAALYSYVPGRNNDRNDRTTIIVSSGTHYIDNRPGYSIQNISGSAVYKKRTGKDTWTTSSLQPFGENTNFDIFDPNNDLYKYNSVNGGIILPRGTSIVGQDLRKTKIRPLYVPDPLSQDVEVSSIFNVTGSCYFSQFTFFDADITKFAYKNYTDTKHVPKFSHHKLTSFVYADGVNKVRLGQDQTDLTDLEMYYYKIARAYDSLSGRGIEDFPANLDFEPNVNEFRIVGPLQENPLGISSIRAGNGDGTGDNSVITVTTADLQSKIEKPHNFAVDTPIVIRGITESPTAYNGSFTVREVVGINTFTFVTTTIPSEVLPDSNTFDVATVSVESDTVSSSSPYIFNCSIRSVYGMCGMWADGARADGFKSMVVAQFTGVSLQKDNDAYLIYDNGVYYDNITLPTVSQLRPLYQNSRAIFKPEFENYHIRCSNDAFIQAVSVFAIGYAKHFLTESGADMSITNSNSNFGATSLNSIGFKKTSFDRDDTGYITHIIPPRELVEEEDEVSWLPLDIGKIQSIADPNKLYIFGYNSKDVVPISQVNGYRIGAREGDKLYLTITGNESQSSYSTPIYMTTPDESEGLISKKTYNVARTGIVNNISNNVLTLTGNHKLFSGEKVRIFSDNAQAPEGLEIDKVYYTITNTVDITLGINQIKLASTLNDALSGVEITSIGNNGGTISVISTVSDKIAGEFGHPIQWDEGNKSWYIFTAQSGSVNKIYDIVSTINIATFGDATPFTFIKRIQENRPIDERLYKLRYVIPKEYINAKAPQSGYILQESKNVAISTISISDGTQLLNSTELRNEKVIVNASAGSILNNKQTVTITTELPHNLIVGDVVKVQSVRSTNNPSGVGIVSSYNGDYPVLSIPSSRTFTYQLEGVKTNPGTFTNNINQRTTTQQRNALPLVSRQSYKNNFYIYRVDTIREHVPGTEGQDGIYHLIVLSSSIGISNNVGYGLSSKYFNQDIRNLYPQVDRDNPTSNPNATISYADLKVVGNVITDDKKKSLTLEVINEFNKNNRVGFGITNITISGVGNTTLTLSTDVEHKLNSIKSVNVISSGAGYPLNTTIYSANLIDVKFNEEDATCRYSTTGTGTINTNSLRLVDVGAAHTVGEQLGVQGGSVTNALVQVTEINNNIGDGLELSGFHSTDLNGIYEIIAVPNKKSVTIYVPEGVPTYTSNTNGIVPIGYIASKGVGISSMILSDLTTGITTVTTSYPHGLSIGNKFKFTKSNIEFYNNKDYIVNEVIGITTFSFSVGAGIATTTTTPSTGKILKYGINSNALNLGRGEENLSSRACYVYSGLSFTLTSSININTTSLNVDTTAGLKRGDFITIGNEIMRIAGTPTSTSFNVLRNQLGTLRISAVSGSVVRKIRVLPVETRRPSFMRASGHTFEYLGYGPGNYSTALPQRQDRVLGDIEVLNSQARREQGGSIVYTGMNDLGEFYTGSTKVSATTGEQTIVGAPILTFTGDDANGELQNSQSGLFDEVLVKSRITVEGGENNNQSSQFYGPVNFDKRVTNLSPEGMLLRNLFIRGSVSQEKLFTVGISTPTAVTIPRPTNGDISFISNPTNNYVGHIYKSNEWRQWGLISNEPNKLTFTLDKVGIGIAPSDVYPLNVAGTAQIQNLRVTGGVVFTQAFNLGDVKFEDVDVYGTMTFLGINPSTGIATNYTQIHERGTSKFNQIETVGVSSFYKDVYINKKNEFGVAPTLYADKIDLANIRVGIAGSNIIDNKFNDLTISSVTGNTIINNSLSVVNGNVAITTNRVPGISTAYITDSRILRLGVGNTNQSSYIDLNNDTSTFDYGLRLIRNSGVGSQSSSIIHRGTTPLFINAIDNGGDVRILSNNTERLRIGTSGTITVFQNNSGENLRGAHLRLTQSGSGDVALSWDTTFNNINRRWYAGIDTSDGYSWKLATPLTTVSYNNENFDTDVKIRVDVNGNLALTSSSGITTINGSNIITNQSTFNLLNSQVQTVNAFGNASTINLAASTNTSKVSINGTTQSTTTSTGALVVSGGVGVAKNLRIGETLFTTKIDSSTSITEINSRFELKGEVEAINLDGIKSPKFVATNPESLVLSGTLTYKMLRADGTQDFITSREIVNALGYTPVNTTSVGNATITLSSGNGISITNGSFTTNQASNGTVTISHADTSSQVSVDNSNGTVIQDITLDTYGHITAIGSVDLDGRYYTESESDARFLSRSTNVWITSSDGKNRLNFTNNGRTYFGSADGLYTWRNASDQDSMALSNGGILYVPRVETSDSSDGIRVANGGDIRLYNTNNGGNVNLYCDTSGTLTVGGNLYASSLISGGTGDGVVLYNGGDIRLYNTNNGGNVNLYCDSGNTLTVGGNVSATAFSGNGTIPVGGIIMWSGSTTPPGWQLCNGSTISSGTLAGQNTPDLRNKFIVGVDSITKSGLTAQTGSSPYDPGDVGGSANAVVVSHQHTGTTSFEGAHRHGYVYATGAAIDGNGTTDHLNQGDINELEQQGSPQGQRLRKYFASTSENGSHSHSFTTSLEGESGINKNLPPYYALAFIMRIL